MPLWVHTARIDFDGNDRLDVSRSSGDPTFAPSWDILQRAQPKLAKRLPPGQRLDWPAYAEAYTQEMRESWRVANEQWTRLLSRSHVVLCCYCVDPAQCHRTVLANILVKLGAVYSGEADDYERQERLAIQEEPRLKEEDHV